MKTIVLARPYGQTSNIFFQHVYFDSFCREHQIKFVNPFMHKYYKDYPQLNEYNRSWIADWSTKKLVKKGLKFKLIKSVDFDNEGRKADYVNYILQGNKEKLFLEGWYFRHEDLVRKYRKVYQQLFAPDVNMADLQQRYLERTDGQLLIGVHIRRGDYKEFLGGKYFYGDEVYVSKITELLAILNKKCRVIIFSNDTDLNKSVYHQHFGEVIISRNNVKTDHYLMSQCDYLIGPPSTFTMWASFMGDKPVHFIESPAEKMMLEKFHIFFA
ncbi:MAG TPA: alpha-1,2-fucosyltransferase [Chitinophaga sp.]|uniref:alpha-1,2-fucosyltransferase n=1 Tax=Chitinophaga sp. TaxID=1869181 RepID=UPI002C22D647|nr:alpha-1,2-fucosyltransferase [Chitinophaga sp.]HVI45335.1 alpha-1,2-fucosyltransferase [Chitinophaga sp.]